MTILLLAPSPPLLFMGEEFGARTPFLFFCDFGGELRSAVTEGRRAEFARFARFSSFEAQEHIPDPNSVNSFARSKLDWSSLPGSLSQTWLQFYRDLLAIRQSAIVPHLSGTKSSASYTVQEDGGLRFEWRFGHAITLTLVANLSATQTTLTSRPIGRVIYANRAGLAEDLERRQAQTEVQVLPWSAAWFLHP